MTNPTGDALKASAAQVTKGKIELWFFRDMLDQNRLALFSLFGIKAESVQTLGGQKLALHSVLSALSPVEQAPQPVGEPVAYSFRLARSISHPGSGQPPVYLNFDDEPRLSFTKPCVPEGSIKDLTALYLTPTEAPPVESQAAWRDIATVPTDERLIIIGSYNGGGQWCSEVWSTQYLRDQFAKSADGFFLNAPHLEWLPTHWMPLPEPPAFAAGGSAE